MTPGVYTLYVEGYIEGLYFTKIFQDIDIVSSNQTADLSGIVNSYYFKMNGTAKTSWQARWYCKKSYGWISNPMSTVFDSSTSTLKCSIQNMDLASIEQMCIVIYSEDEFYIVNALPENAVVSQSMEMEQVKAFAQSIVLNKSDLKQVTLKCFRLMQTKKSL